jgi:uncharacterized protein with ACT and thioredoxin-like domain
MAHIVSSDEGLRGSRCDVRSGRARRMSALRPALGEEENDQIHEEIDLVVRMRVAKLASDLELDRHIKDKLENKPLTMKDRTYLWLYLAIDDIYETYRHSVRPEETSIDTLPSTVGDAYEKILGRVTERQKGNVRTILRVIILW